MVRSRWVALVAVAVAVTVAVVAVALVTRGRSGPSGPSVRGCEAGSDGLKAPLRGLVTITRLPQGAVDPFVGGLSVNAKWADLQPQPDGPISHPNAIDAAVDTVRARRDCRLGVKVRVLAGMHAPDWAKRLDGDPMEIYLPLDDVRGTVGRFWTPAFGAAYADLQRRLAEDYDGVAEVREVAVTRCTTVYGEPFVRQTRQPANVKSLLAAGFSVEADQRCLREQVDAHLVWRRTPSSLALNPYDDVGKSAAVSQDMPLTNGRYCRSTLGARCILANNSIRWPTLEGPYAGIYEGMRRLGPPLEFQTAARARIGDVTQTVAWAKEQGARSVELEAVLVTRSHAELVGALGSGWSGPD